MDWYVDYRNGAPPPDPKWDATRQTMGRARALAERIDLATLAPQSELASSGYCLANLPQHRAQYLAYLPQGGEVTLDLSAAKGLLNVEWTATKSGETRAGPPVSGGSRQRLVAPFAGPAILRMVAFAEREKKR